MHDWDLMVDECLKKSGVEFQLRNSLSEEEYERLRRTVEAYLIRSHTKGMAYARDRLLS